MYIRYNMVASSRSNRINSYTVGISLLKVECGKEYYGRPETVAKLYSMHKKVCESCRNKKLEPQYQDINIKLHDNGYHKLTKGV